MKKTIYPKDWLAKHTYNTLQPADAQYIAFANKVYNLLEQDFRSIPFYTRKTVALAIASYIEDKRSDIGLFSSYVAMTRRERNATSL